MLCIAQSVHKMSKMKLEEEITFRWKTKKQRKIGIQEKTESAKKIKSKATDHWIQSSIITNFHLSSSIPWLGSPSPNTKEKTYGKTISNSLLFTRNKKKWEQRDVIHLHHILSQWSLSYRHLFVSFASYSNLDPSTFHGINRWYVTK